MMQSTIITHLAQAQCKIVRVIPDADRIYSEDPRWQGVTKEERHIAFQIINKLAGGEYLVYRAEWQDNRLFYHLIVRPKLRIQNAFGMPMEIGYAFVPYEYCEVVRQGFMEAR